MTIDRGSTVPLFVAAALALASCAYEGAYTTEPLTVSCPATIPAWAANTTYATGAIVRYQGGDYQCVQGHTSLPDWTPASTPALWTPVQCSNDVPPPPPDMSTSNGNDEKIPTQYPTGPGPANIEVGRDGRLVYVPEPNGDTIPDFSNAGYHGGGVPLPVAPVVTTLNPIAGETDASGRIQAAIDALAAKPLGAHGLRGAILLTRGTYPMSKGLTITASGIVLRGQGDGADGTVLSLTASAELFLIGGSGGRAEVAGTRHTLTDAYVPVGARWFRVDSTAGLAVGDTVVITRPSTTQWIADIGESGHWKAGEIDLDFDRTIVAIEDDRVLVDAPLTQALEQKYGGGTIAKYTWASRVSNVGIEHLRGTCTAGVDAQGNFAGSFVTISKAIDTWVLGATNQLMRGHTVKIENGKWITIEGVTSFHEPLPGKHSGASTQIFTFQGSQLILFHGNQASDGGFEYSSSGPNPGPNVYSESSVPHGFASTAPHMKWAVATLYDALRLHQGLAIQNNSGSHGWTGANQLVWNVEAPGISCDRPPTVHQWIIGSIAAGSVKGRAGNLPCEVISWGTHVAPASLYRAQLAERLGAAALGVLGPAR